MIEVREYNDLDSGAYDQCIVSSSLSLIYPTRPFLSFLQEVTGGKIHCLLAEEDGQILGVFPSLEKRDERFGTVYNSLPWYGSYGGCTLAEDSNTQVRSRLVEAWSSMLQNCNDLLTATAVLSPFEEKHRESYSSIVVNGTIDSRIGQLTPLPYGGAGFEERLMELFSQKTRNLVRKSLKQSFSLIASDDEWAWRFLCETHHENMSAIGGIPKPKAHFDALRRHIPASSREVLIATISGKPVAALLILFFNKTVEYITPVIKHDYRSQQPLSFLIWHGMVRAVERGFAWWNWGGTWYTQESLHHFKAGWGAIDMHYTYLITLGDGALDLLRRDIGPVRTAYSCFYLYPYHQL
jgi:hypothetical protein